MATCTKVEIIQDSATTNKDETTWTRVLFVQFSDGTATSLDALEADDGTTSVPALNDTSGDLYVADVQAERLDDDKTCWHVTVKYTDKVDNDQKDQKDPENPDDPWGLEFTASGVLYTEEAHKTPGGDPIRNTAGEPVNPPLVQEYWDEEFAIAYNIAHVDFDNIALARGKVNSGTITMSIGGTTRSFSPWTLKLVDAQMRWDTSKKCWRVSLRFQYRSDQWKTRVQSKGFNHLDADGKLTPNKNDKDEELTEPQFLSGDGTDYIRSGGTLPAPLEFEMHVGVDFTDLLDGITTVPGV